MNLTDETLLRAAHSSLAISWGTTAPFAIGKARCERASFSQDPHVEVEVTVPMDAFPGVIPVVRQRVFAELAERGWDNTEIAFTPRVALGRRRKFVDENESSSSFGRSKFGEQHTIRFPIVKCGPLHRAAFPIGWGSSWAPIPENPDRGQPRCAVCGGPLADGTGCEFCPKTGLS